MKKFVSKMLAGALGLSMLCGVAAAEGETYVSWYTSATCISPACVPRWMRRWKPRA